MGQAGLAEVGSRGPPVDSAARSGSWDGIPECQISEGRYVRAHTHTRVCGCVCVCVAGGVSNSNAWRVIQECPSRDFPSSSVIETALPLQGLWV